jgi:hypothetical protein
VLKHTIQPRIHELKLETGKGVAMGRMVTIAAMVAMVAMGTMVKEKGNKQWRSYFL